MLPGDVLTLENLNRIPLAPGLSDASHLALPGGLLAAPGTIVVGTSPEVAVAGGVSALGLRDPAPIGSGLTMRVPESIRVSVASSEPLHSCAGLGIDAALRGWGAAGTDRVMGRIVELGGPLVASLSIDQRMAACGLAPLMGAVACLVAPDQALVNEFRQHTDLSFQTHTSASDAQHAASVDATIAAAAHWVLTPAGQPQPAAAARGQVLDRIVVAGPGGGTAETIALLARLLRGRALHHAVRLVVQPDCASTATRVNRLGALHDLEQCGAVIVPAGARLDYALSDERVIAVGGCAWLKARQALRAEAWLTGPHIAAAAALTGEICDPSVAMAPPANDSKLSARHPPGVSARNLTPDTASKPREAK